MEQCSPDIVYFISKYLSPPDLESFTTTCKRIRESIYKHDIKRLTTLQKRIYRDIKSCDKVYQLKTSIHNTYRFFLQYLCQEFKSILIVTVRTKFWSIGFAKNCTIRKSLPKHHQKYKLIIYDTSHKSNKSNNNPKETLSTIQKATLYTKSKVILILYNFRSVKPIIDPEIHFKRPVKFKVTNVISISDMTELGYIRVPNIIYYPNLNSVSICKHPVTDNIQTIILDFSLNDVGLRFLISVYVKYVLKSKTNQMLKIILRMETHKSIYIERIFDLINNHQILNADLLKFIYRNRIIMEDNIKETVVSKYEQGESFNSILTSLMVEDTHRVNIYTQESLSSLTISDLKLICKNKQIRGYSNKNKSQLVDLILNMV